MTTQVQRRRGTAQDYTSSQFVGAEGEFTYDETNKTIRVHDGETEGGFFIARLPGSQLVTGATKCKITYNEFGVITGGANLVIDDIPDLSSLYLTKNNAITGATKCKITYDSKGLVTSGADLTQGDIPVLSISKITGLQSALDNKMPKIPVESDLAGVGSVQLVDNAVNKVVMTGSISFLMPTVTDTSILHQMIVQLYKSTAVWTVSLGTSNYFGSAVAPSLEDAGYYNIYYEYDFHRNVWVAGAIKKIIP